jgi:hypothetical protein
MHKVGTDEPAATEHEDRALERRCQVDTIFRGGGAAPRTIANIA